MFRIPLAALVLLAACRDGVSPAPQGSRIMLDQANDVFEWDPWGTNGTHIGKGFDPRNPHLGDAIIATFFWRGSTNTITEVTDHLSDADHTPVGNQYTLLEYVTAGGISMATYVATNVQGFSDADTRSGQILAVHAIFSEPVTGGVKLSAWTGVNAEPGQAIAAHRSASGVATGVTPASPGATPLDTGSLIYAVTMSHGQAGFDRPTAFTQISTASDTSIVQDAEYSISAGAEPLDPQWAWYFNDNTPSPWLATALALRPIAHRLP